MSNEPQALSSEKAHFWAGSLLKVYSSLLTHCQD